MKRVSNILGLWLLMLAMVTVVICEGSDAPYNGHVEITQGNAATFMLKGYENSQAGFTVFKPGGFQSPFYVQDKTSYDKQYALVRNISTRLSEMKTRPEADTWQTDGILVMDGTAYWIHTETLVAHQCVKFRMCSISDDNVTIEYVIEEDVKSNANASTKNKSGYSLNLEIPHLNEVDVFVAYSLKVNGTELPNHVLGWDDTEKHSSQAASVFNETTRKAGDGMRCKDNLVIDPLLLEAMQATDEQYKSDGSDRGHICGSTDHLSMREANDQTSYFSNMFPTVHFFNSPYWTEFEGQVRKQGGTEKDFITTCSKLYVVKGGALSKLLISYTGQKNGDDSIKPTTNVNGSTKGGPACPKYYFMAVLSEADDVYHAIGFRVEHREHNRVPALEELKTSALSIDELGEKTGIDFFYNLSDDLENTMESSMSLDDWTQQLSCRLLS